MFNVTTVLPHNLLQTNPCIRHNSSTQSSESARHNFTVWALSCATYSGLLWRWSHWTCSSLGTIFQPMRINSVPDVKCFCNNKNVLCAQSVVWHFVRLSVHIFSRRGCSVSQVLLNIKLTKMGSHYSVECDSFIFTEGSFMFGVSPSAVVFLSQLGTVHSTIWGNRNGCSWMVATAAVEFIKLCRDGRDTSACSGMPTEIVILVLRRVNLQWLLFLCRLSHRGR